MELNFHYRRLLLLIACLAGFALLGGFTPPDSSSASRAAQATKAWTYCIIMFSAGAVLVSVIEHRVGYIDPTSLRPAYILLGIGLMVASILWLRVLREGMERASQAGTIAGECLSWV
jgi:hypothetical protein